MRPQPGSPVDLLRGAVGRDGGRPFLTWYDVATGARVELSVTTFDNWVAKTAGLLRDGLGIASGERVGLLFPVHWQSLVWVAGVWTAGCCVVLGDSPEDIEVAVAGPDKVDAALATGAEDVVAVALNPLGMPVTEPLPAGVLDYAREVASQPDRFQPDAPVNPVAPALDDGLVVRPLGGLAEVARDRAEAMGLATGARILRSVGRLDHTAVIDLVVVPLVLDGSMVLVRAAGELDLRRIARAERALIAGEDTQAP